METPAPASGIRTLWGLRILQPECQMFTSWFLIVAKLQLWSSNNIILWLGVTTMWGTVLIGPSIRVTEKHCPHHFQHGVCVALESYVGKLRLTVLWWSRMVPLLLQFTAWACLPIVLTWPRHFPSPLSFPDLILCFSPKKTVLFHGNHQSLKASLSIRGTFNMSFVHCMIFGKARRNENEVNEQYILLLLEPLKGEMSPWMQSKD